MQNAEMLDLMFSLVDTLAQHLQHIAAFGQLPLKREQIHNVT